MKLFRYLVPLGGSTQWVPVLLPRRALTQEDAGDLVEWAARRDGIPNPKVGTVRLMSEAPERGVDCAVALPAQLWACQPQATRDAWVAFARERQRHTAVVAPTALFHSRAMLDRWLGQAHSSSAWADATQQHPDWHEVVFRCAACGILCRGDFPRMDAPPPTRLLLCGLTACVRRGIRPRSLSPAQRARMHLPAVERLAILDRDHRALAHSPDVLRDAATAHWWVPLRTPVATSGHDPLARMPWSAVPDAVRREILPPGLVDAIPLSLHDVPFVGGWADRTADEPLDPEGALYRRLSDVAADWRRHAWPLTLEGVRRVLLPWIKLIKEIAPSPLARVMPWTALQHRLQRRLPAGRVGTDTAALHCALVPFPTQGTLTVRAWVVVRCRFMKDPLRQIVAWKVPRARDPRWQAMLLQAWLCHHWSGPADLVPLLLHWRVEGDTTAITRATVTRPNGKGRVPLDRALKNWAHLADASPAAFRREPLMALRPSARQAVGDAEMPVNDALHSILGPEGPFRSVALLCPACARPFHTLQHRRTTTPHSQSPPLFCDGLSRCLLAGDVTHTSVAGRVRFGPRRKLTTVAAAPQPVWALDNVTVDGYAHDHEEATQTLAQPIPLTALAKSVRQALHLGHADDAVSKHVLALPHRFPSDTPLDVRYAEARPPARPLDVDHALHWVRLLLHQVPFPHAPEDEVDDFLDLLFDDDAKTPVSTQLGAPKPFAPPSPSLASARESASLSGRPTAAMHVLGPAFRPEPLFPVHAHPPETLLAWPFRETRRLLDVLPSVADASLPPPPHPKATASAAPLATPVLTFVRRLVEGVVPQMPPFGEAPLRAEFRSMPALGRTPERTAELEREVCAAHEWQHTRAPDWFRAWPLLVQEVSPTVPSDALRPFALRQCGYDSVAFAGVTVPSPDRYPGACVCVAVLVGPSHAGLLVCTDPRLLPASPQRVHNEQATRNGHWRLRHWERPDSQKDVLAFLRRHFRASREDVPEVTLWRPFVERLVEDPRQLPDDRPVALSAWKRSPDANAPRADHRLYDATDRATWKHARWSLSARVVEDTHTGLPLVVAPAHTLLFQGTSNLDALAARHQAFGTFDGALEEAWRHVRRLEQGVIDVVRVDERMTLFPLAAQTLRTLFRLPQAQKPLRAFPIDDPRAPPLLRSVPLRMGPLQRITGFHPDGPFTRMSPLAELASASGAVQDLFRALLTRVLPETPVHGLAWLPHQTVVLFDSSDGVHVRPASRPLGRKLPWAWTATRWRPDPRHPWTPGEPFPLLQHTGKEIDDDRTVDPTFRVPAPPRYPLPSRQDPIDRALGASSFYSQRS